MAIARRRALIALPALLAAGLWWQFVWSARADAVAEVTTSIEATQHSTTVMQRKVRNATELRDGGPAALEHLAALEAALPERDEIGELLRQHEALAAQWGVTVVSVTPQADGKGGSKPPAGLDQVTVALRVSGTADAVEHYLIGLGELPRANSIVDLGLTNEGDGRMSVELRLAVYIDD